MLNLYFYIKLYNSSIGDIYVGNIKTFKAHTGKNYSMKQFDTILYHIHQ